MNTSLGSTTGPGNSSATSLLARLKSSDETGNAAQTGNLGVREKFQDFAAGTFYKEMLKALRQGQKHSKYFYGGQAEEIFRGQMDQQVAEDLAHQHGGAFAGPLYDRFTQQSQLGSSQVSSLEQAHAFDAVA